jgi:hypothetical protein
MAKRALEIVGVLGFERQFDAEIGDKGIVLSKAYLQRSKPPTNPSG